MIRPRLALATLATMALGTAAGAAGAELEPLGVLFAQSATVPRGPGFYLNFFKFVPIVLLFFMWAWTTSWIEVDTHDPDNLKQDYSKWPIIAFFTFPVAVVLLWLIPFYIIGLILVLLAYFIPLFVYIGVRNAELEYTDKVLTSYHFGEIGNKLARAMGTKGPFNLHMDEDEDPGPPLDFFPKVKADQIEPELLLQARESEAYIPAREIVYDAISRRATEIALEPGAEETTVRYRIDGVPHTAEPFDRETGDAVTTIFKILSALDVNERRKPQEGIMGAKYEGRDVELRVETSGSKGGEKVAMRILDAPTITKLDDLGMRPKLAAEIKEILKQDRGLFVCCGPAGSGKTTTLYACLREIDRFLTTVASLEDIIEAKVDNVQQIEIGHKVAEPVANQLRSLIRTEPDVIMVGELQDAETATVVCQGATTKCLMLSSVQADDAVKALFRILDLGVEPALLASALTAIMSQRLVRVLCESCKEPYKPKPELLKKANLPADKVDVFYRPPVPNPEEPREPCEDCGETHYVGRTGIFELLVMTDALRELVRENPSINAIKAEARKNGMFYLHEDGLRQVFQGRTSIDELRRIVG